LAFRLAGAGMKVAVVERHLVGGTCVNTGCTPAPSLPRLRGRVRVG
jgi:pyruvate/2-oxoglutarate dehydrogenase complex dihydrolipoamide dehydrogenase (E3) component